MAAHGEDLANPDTSAPPAATASGPSRLQTVEQRLRTAIVQGRFGPNERLIETELAAWLAVSRTPVREALQRLAADRLVVSRRRGWVVYAHTPDEVREIYEARVALEGYAARLAAERASAEQLAGIMAAQQEALRSLAGSREALVEANDRFHAAVTLAAGNRQLADLLERNRLYHFNYRLAATYTDAEVAEGEEQHAQLTQAIRARDTSRAEAIMRAHIERALVMIVRRMGA
jgi:DNA-binding GntR family transcriptional regulator